MHPIRLRGALSALLLSLVVIGCGGASATTTPSVATTPPSAEASDAAPSAEATAATNPGTGGLPTTGRIEVADKGFALTLPDGWTRVDISAGDLDAIIAAAGSLDPALAQQYSAQVQAMLAAGLSVFAFGPEPQSGTTLMVLAVPGGGLSLDLLEQINSAQLEALAEGGVESERITLPAGDAIHYRYVLKGASDSPALDQYFLIAGDNQLVVTISGASEADAQAIANSIEVLD